MPVGIAILGAGIFARDEHLPAIQACRFLSLKATYSRSKCSAEKLAENATKTIDCYFDLPFSPGRSLTDLLERDDIDAVVIALPIVVQPEVIKRAITAGKHVLSERPIAKDMKTATELIRWYRNPQPKGIWSVAENFRFMSLMSSGAEQIKVIGGDVVTFGVKLYGFVGEDDKYYQTPWRQYPGYQGGFLLDGGIHFVAGLRLLLAAAGQSITQVAAFTSLLQKNLAPVDTVHATVKTSNDRSGIFCVSFGAEFKSDFEIQVVTNKGAVTITPSKVVVLRKAANGDKEEETKGMRFDSGVGREIAAFAASTKLGMSDSRATPEQAFMDLTVLQRMLESGEQDGMVMRI